MRIEKPSFDQVVGMPSVLALFIIFFLSGWIDGIKLLTFILLALNIIWCRNAFREKVIFVVFNLTFFFFLVGRTFIEFFLPDVEAMAIKPFFNLETQHLTHALIFTSIFVIRLAFSLGFQSIDNLEQRTEPDGYLLTVRKLASISVYVLMPLYLIVLVERIAFVSVHGYEASYVFFKSGLPLYFIRIATLYEPILFLYLATFPTRSATFRHLIFYVIISASSLFYGQRGGFVLSLLFTIIYLVIRDLVTPGQTLWFSKKIIILSLVSAVPFVSFLAVFTFIRSDIDFFYNSYLEMISFFLISQGSAIFNLSYTIDLNNMFPPAKFYSLGPVIAFLHDNIFSQLLFGTNVFAKASPELALSGHNFSFALTYFVNPLYYYIGGGFGSNFIAELWIDFGIMGVIAGSAMYGLLMKRFIAWQLQRGPFFIAFSFAGVQQLFYAPRDVFLGFLIPSMSMMTIAVYLLVHFSAKKFQKTIRVGSEKTV